MAGYYERPEDVASTVFDPSDDTFGPIMAAIQKGELELASSLLGNATGMSVDVESPAARALRAIQRYDEAVSNGDNRYLLVAAETALGELLGLTCTGAVDGTNEDGSPAYYAHDGDTCPIHEWLVPSDNEGEA